LSTWQQARTQQTHSVELRQAYERVLAGASVRSRHLEVGAGNWVHLLEKGAGPPVVLIHGTGSSAGFLLPLLNELHGVHGWPPTGPGRA
jgi:pimeloyl-ACP methyl ester carboxylesterase